MSAFKNGRKSYKIFCDEKLYKKIGSISINFLGNDFTIKTDNDSENKCEIKYVKILYFNIIQNINIFGLNGPTKIHVNVFKKNSSRLILINKEPEFSESIYFIFTKFLVFNCYVLNFIQRTIKSSVKNFQLISSSLNNNNNNNIILQFAESKEENEFFLDYKYPLSPIQAFGIGISSIKKKLLC